MFRKYYKEANDSIKPSEDFVNSVIRDAKKHKPPLRARYTQYAAVAAAAVVVVTGAVTAFPLLQRAQRDGDRKQCGTDCRTLTNRRSHYRAHA